MVKRLVLLIMIVFLLTGLLTLTVKIQVVRSDWSWTETIQIKGDGSIYPTAAPISSTDNVTYTLTDNIVGHIPQVGFGILVIRSNIVLDGAGHTLRNTVRETNSQGIECVAASNVTIQNLNVENFYHGIIFYDYHPALGALVWRNNLTDNYVGIRVFQSSGVTISQNAIINNTFGIALDSYDEAKLSYGNTVFENNLTKNQYGILTNLGSNNKIYHNNFNNSVQVQSSQSTNTWDDDYPSGGNYWSDYSGVDEKRGVDQNETGSDGIGDTPYTIGIDQDHYPLMHQWRTHALCDVNGDGSVDMADISLMIDWFMTSPPNWNPNCDVNSDLTVDMADISIAIDHFMQT